MLDKSVIKPEYCAANVTDCCNCRGCLAEAGVLRCPACSYEMQSDAPCEYCSLRRWHNQQAATISQLRDALEKAKYGLETAGMGARYIDQALAEYEQHECGDTPDYGDKLRTARDRVNQQAATISQLVNAINGLLLAYEPRFASEDGMPISIGSSRIWQDEISAAKKAAGVALVNAKTNGTICDWTIRAKAAIQELTDALQGLKRMRYEACDDSGAWEQADAALAKVKYDPST